MRVLPIERIIYKTTLKEDEIIHRLTEVIEPKRTFRLGFWEKRPTKPYEGEIRGHRFEMQRIISYRNSFLPQMEGFIQRDVDGTTIKVNMRLHMLVVIFLGIWCGVVGLAGLAFLTEAWSKAEFSPAAFIPCGMLLFVYAITMGGFKFESSKSKKDLQRIFEAEILDS